MSLRISNLEHYKIDCDRYQKKIDQLSDSSERLKFQSLLRDYKNLVHKMDTNIENIMFDDINRSLDRQRSDSKKLQEIKQQLNSII